MRSLSRDKNDLDSYKPRSVAAVVDVVGDSLAAPFFFQRNSDMKSYTIAVLTQAVSLFTLTCSIAVPAPVVELGWDTDAACTNGPNTRACWKNGFSIATDFDAKLPPEGKTIIYDLEITNTTMAPDGFERLIMAVNGQYREYLIRLQGFAN